MPAAAARPITQIAGLALAGATAFAVAGALHPDTAVLAAPGGLSASYSGPVFAVSGDRPPALHVSRLGPGHAASGTVKVTNPGAGSRWFWLGAGEASDWVGPGSGRLSSDLGLAVLDVTKIGGPVDVYHGPATLLGARPLGFIAPGATRTFTVTASLPADPGLPRTATRDPYSGSRLTMPLTWHSIEGSPAATQTAARPVAKQRPARPVDRTGPSLAITVDRAHHPLRTGRLAFVVRCGERCVISARGSVAIGARSWPATASASSTGSRRAAMDLPMPEQAMRAMRRALTSGVPVRIRMVVAARDRHGNSSAERHGVTLQPRR